MEFQRKRSVETNKLCDICERARLMLKFWKILWLSSDADLPLGTIVFQGFLRSWIIDIRAEGFSSVFVFYLTQANLYKTISKLIKG